MKNNLNLRVFHVVLIVAISLIIGYSFGSYRFSIAWKGYRPIADVVSKAPPPGQNINMSLFYDVLEKLNTSYYDKKKINSQKIVYGAITGMLQSLDDPYTSFFPPVENTNFKNQMAGEFSGIGAELGLNDKNIISVTAPLDGSPALKAGVKAGDLIIKVDDLYTQGWTLQQAVDHIRGHKGTKVSLTILHEGEKTPIALSIIRDTIQIKSVTSWIKQFNCNGGDCAEATNCPSCASIAYIRLSQFGDKTNDEWLQAINSLTPKIAVQKNYKGLILDVRNNPGGYLHDAVYIASEFLKNGSTVVVQEDGDGNKEPLKVERTGLYLDKPLIVLVNKGSASASEILSGALQDFGRARLMGEQSFGKGTVQAPIDVTGGGSVHISIAKWLTPKERWIHGKGLTPDIEVKYDATASGKMKDNMDNQILRAIQELSK